MTVCIIAAMSEHFCDRCNRLRVTAVGDLHACLAYDDAKSLRDIMRGGGTDADVESAVREAVASKRQSHQLSAPHGPAHHKPMIAIGG